MHHWSGGETPPQLSAEAPGGEILPGEVHVWWLQPPRTAEFPKRESFLNLVDGAEWERAQRFRFASDAWAYLSARSLLRRMVATQLQRHALDLRFTCTEYGRPLLAEEANGLFFSVTHTRSMVACALSCEKAVGIDVENSQRRVQALELAESFFTHAETKHLKALPTADCVRDFFVQWTLKEAFLKAIGMGLHASTQTLSILPRKSRLAVTFECPFPESRTGWGFWAAAGWHDHHLALALRSDAATISICLGEAPPPWNVAS